MNEPSNKKLITILIIVVVLFLVLLGVWLLWDGKSVNDQATTESSRPLTETEKAEITAQNRAVMLQFATTAPPISLVEAQKVMQTNEKVMQLFAPTKPTPSTGEAKANYKLMKLFQ